MAESPQSLISTREAATILEVDPRTVQRQADSLGAVKLPGQRGSYVFDRSVIEAHAAAKRGDK
jgi:DNA-binding transcriptional regulator YhcF (GntR family)